MPMAGFRSSPEFEQLRNELEAILLEEGLLYRRILDGTTGMTLPQQADAMDDVGARKMEVWNKMQAHRLDAE